MAEKAHIEELRLCLKIWEKDGFCTFGNRTECDKCGAPYVLWKLITGEILHNGTPRLKLDEWKSRLKEFDSSIDETRS